VPLKLIIILFYAHWETKGGLYQNLSINATEIPRRDEDAATAFFKQAINNNGLPDKVVMDKSARTSESEVRLVFRHNYPAKAINCL
jgi:transposase-like protein